jgi:hypothetical protein
MVSKALTNLGLREKKSKRELPARACIFLGIEWASALVHLRDARVLREEGAASECAYWAALRLQLSPLTTAPTP